MTDRTIAHYRILESLGEGGMGVVYKAEDTRLKRVVALKFLTKDVTGAGEAGERFLREARAAAALDHPNICTIYEIQECDGETFLAMAYLEGRPLDEQIAEGPLPLELTCEIAKQTAEGLAAAHTVGVIHRDIKPSNIMVGKDRAGRPAVKIMDFGLAQVSGASKLTKVETRMGTVAYMSPEQSVGDEVGPVTDLWSLGVVIYEMVTGTVPFRGHYDQAILYSILNEEPAPVTSLRSRVPMELEWIIEKCLAKSPGDRYQEARELVSDLELLQRRVVSGRTSIRPIDSQASPTPEAAVADSGLASPIPAVAGLAAVPRPVRADVRSSLRAAWWKWLLGAGALTVALVVGLLVPAGANEDSPRVRKFTLRPFATAGAEQGVRRVAVSPDGRVIAFSTSGTESALWLQSLDRLDPIRVEGTEGARAVFWSPDSQFVGFATNRGIGRVSVSGLGVTMLLEETGLAYASAVWSADGQSILYSKMGGQIMTVPAVGGLSRPLPGVQARRRSSPMDLAIIPLRDGSQTLLYSERSLEGGRVMIQRIVDDRAGEAVHLIDGATPVYSATGHLLFRPATTTSALWAVPFSPEDSRMLGEPFLIAQSASHPSVAADGTLVYVDDPNNGQMHLSWLDRQGNIVGSIGRPQAWILGPRISPSGDRVLVAGGSGRDFDLWVHDADREVINRLTFDDREEVGAIWSPDGRQVLFAQRDSTDLRLVSVGGGSPDRVPVANRDEYLVPLDWSRDGRYVLVRNRRGRAARSAREREDGPSRAAPETAARVAETGPGTSISYLERSGEEWEFREFLSQVPYMIDDGRFSPDGRYIAYESNESGEFDIFVRAFPVSTERWQLTTDGGRKPLWSHDGRHLYFVRDETLFEVPVDTRDGFESGEAVRLFTRDGLAASRRDAAYSVAPDGRFAISAHVGGAERSSIRVVLNWAAEFVAP